MTKKKLIIWYILIIFMILIVGLIAIYYRLKEKNQVYENFDIAMLKENIETQANFNSNRMQDITIENVEEILSIDKMFVDEVIGKVPLFQISSGMYVVIHTKEENVKTIEDKLISYGNEHEEEWSNYMEDQYELVKQRKIGHVGNYVYLIISENAEDMIEQLN